MPDLEERVAALEGAINGLFAKADAPASRTADGRTRPGPSSSPPLTEADMADLQEAIDEVAKHGPYLHFPSVPPLTPDQVRQLLRECVTVVKPGEVLILRAGEDWKPQQVREVQEVMTGWLRDSAPGVKALIVPPFEIAIVPGGAPGAA